MKKTTHDFIHSCLFFLSCLTTNGIHGRQLALLLSTHAVFLSRYRRLDTNFFHLVQVIFFLKLQSHHEEKKMIKILNFKIRRKLIEKVILSLKKNRCAYDEMKSATLLCIYGIFQVH